MSHGPGMIPGLARSRAYASGPRRRRSGPSVSVPLVGGRNDVGKILRPLRGQGYDKGPPGCRHGRCPAHESGVGGESVGIHLNYDKEMTLTTRQTNMLRNGLVLGLLAAALAASGAVAQTTTAPAQQAANAVDPASIRALKEMGAYLQSLKRFWVSVELTGERVLADGQKLQHTATASLEVDRPNRLRALIHSPGSRRDIFYDGSTVTLYTPAQNYYAAVEFRGTIGELIDRLEEKYGVEMPLADLFAWGTSAAPVDKIQSAMNAGQDFVAKELCDHYAFRQDQLDWQVWIASTGKPLPRKIVVTYRGDEARPQSMSIIDWNLKPTFKDSVFKFVPPREATKIEIVPVKNN